MLRPIVLLPLVALSACQVADGSPVPGNGAAPAARLILDGTVAYRQRIALPPDARVTVRISGVSRMDVAAPVIAETVIDTAGRQVPIPFTLDYDPSRIESGANYAVSARITDASGQLLWTTDTHVPLPAPGTPIELMLVQVP